MVSAHLWAHETTVVSMSFVKPTRVIHQLERKHLSCNKVVAHIIMGLLKGDKGSAIAFKSLVMSALAVENFRKIYACKYPYTS